MAGGIGGSEMSDKYISEITPRRSGKSRFYQMFMDSNNWNSPVWIGVDWSAGHGMIRGEVIKREGNITYVRFNSVTLGATKQAHQ